MMSKASGMLKHYAPEKTRMPQILVLRFRPSAVSAACFSLMNST